MINHFVPTKNKTGNKYKTYSLAAKKNTKCIYKPIINAFVFDIETT